MSRDEPLLLARDLARHYRAGGPHPFARPRSIRAVDGINFKIATGETLGLVGESGCGKSTAGRLVTGMEFPTSGKIEFAGRRGPREVQMIFQNAQASLDPRMMVGLQIREPLDIHGIGSAISRNAKTSEMLEAVGLPSALASRYPHELSGGQLQRVVIARALILEPRLLVADEPVSALDVSVQAQVVNLLADLQRRFGLTILFISHDLKIVRYISHEIAVMYLGKIVETGPSGQLLDRPLHPYTRALVSAVPVPVPGRRHDRIILRGEPPSPSAPPPGCRFHTRCPDALAICSRVAPPLLCHPEGRSVACHLHTEAGLAS